MLRHSLTGLSMQSNKKIFYLINTFSVGGAENHLLTLVTALVKLQIFEVHVAFFDEASYSAKSLKCEFSSLQGVTLHNVGNISRFRVPNLLKLFAILRRVKPDIIHTLLFKADLFGFGVGKLLGVRRFVCTINDNEIFAHHRNRNVFRIFEKLMNYVYSRYDAVIVISNAIAKTVNEKFPLVNTDKLKLIYYGTTIGVPKFDGRKYLLDKLGVDDSEFIIGCIGRIDKNKRQDLLISAFLKLPCESTSLALVGHDDYGLALNLKNGIAEHNKKAKIHLLGFDENIPEILNGLDLLVCCSTNEGLGLIVIEGMLSRVPIIVSNSGAYVELIDKSCGYIFSNGDPDSLAKAIQSFQDDKEVGVKIERAYNRAKENFTIEKMLEETVRVYSE